ncbi:matrixin family metalloprotease [Cellulomonas composti]|uniref:Peptidase metallopeptidase domain-containing protein n=1 Tax=Cellulomonas composti TaxID=266130 RepID=A0A511JAQ8_9CELL|nr:matrixin family metalloprotease [Cellulomonas composti]GEL95080.1 hypothetical protein CCO02nite_17380 [Cellulomonas composti]
MALNPRLVVADGEHVPDPDDLPRSPSGRLPQWVLDEAAGRAHVPTLGPPDRRTRRDLAAFRRLDRRAARAMARGGAGVRQRTLVVLIAVLSALIGTGCAVLWYRSLPDQSLSGVRDALMAHPGDAEAAGAHMVDDGSRPPAGVGEGAAPLGTPPVVAWDGSPYAFEATQTVDGEERPVTWDPCRVVHYAVSTYGAPDAFAQDVTRVVAEAQEATGLVFVDDGPTTELVGAERAPYQPERYGERWAPLLIGFSDETLLPDLAGGVVGLGGPGSVRAPSGLQVVVSGQVSLDAELLTTDGRRAVDRRVFLGVLRHELAHAIGLDHVDDPSQLMNPEMESVYTYQTGDLYGLSELGSGVCAPEL